MTVLFLSIDVRVVALKTVNSWTKVEPPLELPLDPSGPSLTALDHLGPPWTALDRPGPPWTLAQAI